jgi:mRNA interferase MazF
MVIQRGSIWWASLPDSIGSMPGYRRPAVIVQDNNFTQSRLQTVLVVVLTSNLKLAAAPGNVLLPAHTTGLPMPSVANVSQIIAVDKSLLTEEIGQVPARDMSRIEEGLRLILALR